ncbi:FAD-binding oxidoreductase [Siculibacillus lacustris]|uniref:FAD-binding oxidoreductase n=1 Tax=Siculibacillus lacustris TaxID=1549641 RepID=A0A4Q9VV61_9HYPH|nr:FAD-binding oxidoreductase [Siculibacillus lacustris]TBW40096.1 FAD-binding oxidoreductase [Siculibacillus lacustris]
MTDFSRPAFPADVLDRLRRIVGATHVETDPIDIAPHLEERRGLWHGATPAVVSPGTTAEVAAVLALADARGLKIVPQGGNTGLVGGQTPSPVGDEIVLSLTRLDRIREVDPASDTMTVEAGVTLARAQEAAAAVDRLFPLSLASEGSCTIGGNLATNAGGTAVIAHGNARDLVLGIEVVLADGRVLNGLGKLRKDNTGYDLKHLFIGSEGTLGIITAAVLKLVPRPAAIGTAFVATPSPATAVALLGRAKAAFGQGLTGFELMPRFGLDLVLKHLPGARDPIAGRHDWYVLLEVAAMTADGLDERLEAFLEAALSDGEIEDGVIAGSLDQRAALWRMREGMSDVQSLEGGSIKHDVSVPIAAVPEVIEQGIAAARTVVPDIRPVPFGHLGDGNIHFNFTQPVGADKAAYLARWGEVNRAVHAVVVAHGGSVSAEHGIGVLKRELLTEVKDPTALAVMRALKATLDPKGLLNPGKVL